MKKSSVFVLTMAIFCLASSSIAIADMYFVSQITPGMNGKVEARASSETSPTIMEVNFNGQKWARNLGQDVWPRSIQFPTNDTAIMLADTWGNGTYLYFFSLRDRSVFRKWVIKGEMAKLAILKESAIISVVSRDSKFNRVSNVYFFESLQAKPKLIKSFAGAPVIYFGYQQKGTSYYGFAVMAVDPQYQALVYRVTNKVVESVPSGHRQLTYWSQVQEFRLIDGMGLVARISDMTFD